ncbi:MAG: hypothetical protein J6R38_02225 [Alistipes sp.]|nr:hypothetical protein [Alistipes sp.]
MRGLFRHIVMMLLSLLVLASCDKTIHEYPGHREMQLTVNCSVDLSDPEHFVTVKCEADTGASYVVRSFSEELSSTRFDEPVCLRYIIDLYRITASHSSFVERKVCFSPVSAPNPQASATFDVDAAHYKVLVWCDYVQDDVLESWYYNTDNLREIRYSEIIAEDNDDKDAFTNVLDVDLSEYYYADGIFDLYYDLMLERPMGRMRCITTDMDDYVNAGNSIEDIIVKISYTQYVSAGYNVEEQKPNYFEPTRTYITTPEVDDDGNLELCHDYIFVNGKQTNVKVDFYFYNGEITEEKEISHWTGIVVPLKKNMETTVEGRMLTTSFGTGGFGIDSEFEDEIVIEWRD